MYEPGPPRTTSVGESVELAPRSPDPDGTYRWTVRDAPADSTLSAGDGPDPDATGPPSSATTVGPDGAAPETGSAATTGSDDSTAAVLRAGETGRDDDPVVHLAPDAPGTYVLALDAPDGVHRQRVRVFPDERREADIRVPASDLDGSSGGESDDSESDDSETGDDEPGDEVDRVSLLWPLNENRLACDRAEREGDDWVARVRVPPGSHGFALVPDGDRGAAHHGVCEVPGPGRPRVSLDAAVVGTDDADETARLRLTAAVEPAPAVDGVARGGDPEALGATFLVDDRDADPDAVAGIESRADGRTLSVPLDALRGDGVDDAVRIHAVPHGERYGAAETVRAETGGDGDGATDADDIAVTDPHPTPPWAESPTIYEVFVRSFAGDTLPTTFREIERRVEYLDHLGVDALWLTPVLASPTDHGYHVTDYYDTAADLGSREAFESLVDACHDAGIRVIFDLVINHTSRDHPAFQLHSAGVDAYADHYRRTDAARDVTGIDWAELGDGDVPDYYFEWGRIPNLNYDSPTVREWLLDVVDEWAGVVDGFRADVAWGVPHGFWKEVADRVPDDVLLLDETLPHDPFYGEGEFHRHYDTSLYDTLRAVGAGEEPADAVETALARGEWLGFGEGGHEQMRYVENHDEDRYLAAYGRDALRAAAAVTFTLPGAPMIYAGQERGNETYRGPIRWHDGDNALTEFHRELAALRASEPLLREGGVTFGGRAAGVRVVGGDADRVTAYERTPPEGTETRGDDPDDRDALLVVVNFGAEPATVAVPDSVDADLFGDGSVRGGDEGDDGEAVVAVDSVTVLR
ncbi:MULTISPECIES: alpha-amylase family glycosyl hydrolase [Halorubrum]|uniref:Alpha amylase catalytic region n=1 Tax=Halorubrum hochstenium ATCC 700873 TaxID=1227481 RepID=M0FL82_9EURY|nr:MULTISPECIES: alpha-amylase family glycosyl hydrolase [Halorubrum]ELZ59349.1 alpha amylase catalytic region [Halorubrum hochstenium ATCC 700873]